MEPEVNPAEESMEPTVESTVAPSETSEETPSVNEHPEEDTVVG